MNSYPSALLVDDDEWFRRVFRLKLKLAIPEVVLFDRSKPDISGDFSIYFLDNQFGDVPLASTLVRQIRETNSQALVIALSATLDAPTLRALINGGCNGACEKGNDSELVRAFEVVRAYIAAQKDRLTISGRPGITSAVRSITELLREWNTRLEINREDTGSL